MTGMNEHEPIQPLQQLELDYTDPNWEPDPIDAGPGKDFFFFFWKTKYHEMDQILCLLHVKRISNSQAKRCHQHSARLLVYTIQRTSL